MVDTPRLRSTAHAASDSYLDVNLGRDDEDLGFFSSQKIANFIESWIAEKKKHRPLCCHVYFQVQLRHGHNEEIMTECEKVPDRASREKESMNTSKECVQEIPWLTTAQTLH